MRGASRSDLAGCGATPSTREKAATAACGAPPVGLYVCMYIYIYIYTCIEREREMYVCMYVCMYIYIYIYREREI